MSSSTPEASELGEQAWALQVTVDILGAHLEAYVNMQPTLQMIRLCNRFGQGDCGISRLPIELVEQVEQYLLEQEREKQRFAWAQDMACSEKSCEILDHFSPDEVHEIYHQQVQDEDSPPFYANYVDRDCALFGGSGVHSPEHVAFQREEVESYVETNDSWFEVCCGRREDWQGRVGWSWSESWSETGSWDGKLGDMSKVMMKDFGLRIKVDRGADTWASDPVGVDNEPTSTYLLMPPVSDSSTAIEPSGARFRRAVQSLNLEMVAVVEMVPTLCTKTKIADSSDGKSMAATGEEGTPVTLHQVGDLLRLTRFPISFAERVALAKMEHGGN